MFGTATSNDLAGRRPARETSERDAPAESAASSSASSCSYIDWATYEENQRMIRRNSVNWDGTNRWRDSRWPGSSGWTPALRTLGTQAALRIGRHDPCALPLQSDYDDGGQYCIGFGGSSVDRCVGQELLKAIAPLGGSQSAGYRRTECRRHAQRAALSRKLEQLVYEARKAFEQYDAWMPGIDLQQRVGTAVERKAGRDRDSQAAAFQSPKPSAIRYR